MPALILALSGCPSPGGSRFDPRATPFPTGSVSPMQSSAVQNRAFQEGLEVGPARAPAAAAGSAVGGPAAAASKPEASLPDAAPAASPTTLDEAPLLGPPEPIPDCEAKLTEAGVRFAVHPLPVHREHGIECGAPQVIEYKHGPTGIRWSPVPIVSCGLALALARFERMLQDEARRDLGVGIAQIEQAGTYNCRSMARFRQVSEHAYANAIDLRSFRTTAGKTISVLDHFGRPGHAPPTQEGEFLRRTANRCYDDGIFSVVVTRFYDELHRDHVHVDMARYRVDGSR